MTNMQASYRRVPGRYSYLPVISACNWPRSMILIFVDPGLKHAGMTDESFSAASNTIYNPENSMIRLLSVSVT